MFSTKMISGLALIFGFLLFLILPGIAGAQDQEFVKAKTALEAAQKAQAEKYAPEPLKQAQEYLTMAEEARNAKDNVKFMQASRLAKAYADLARVNAELKDEEGKLGAANEELIKAKAEIENVKKSR